MAGRFAQAHVARNHGLIDLIFENLAHFLRNLHAQIGARVEHRQHDALDGEMSVHLLHLLHRAHQRAHAFQREIFALNRNQHAVRRAERVERNHAQRRRAVDKDIVKPIPHAFQHVGHDALAVFHVRQLNFRARQPDIRRKHH